jgi:hypothetical protein
MKIIMAFAIMLVTAPVVIGQKKEFKENTLKEISCLVENAYEFLDKPATAILAAGRPVSIQGGDKWEVTLVDTVSTSTKNSSDLGNPVMIGTGCGALTLIISYSTRVVYAIMYMPHKKARINEEDLIKTFHKYAFNDTGEATVETANSKPVQLSISQGIILIIKPDK